MNGVCFKTPNTSHSVLHITLNYSCVKSKIYALKHLRLNVMSFWGKVNSFFFFNHKLCCICCADSCLLEILNTFFSLDIQEYYSKGIHRENIHFYLIWQTMFNAKFSQKILAFKGIMANFLATRCSKHFFVFLATMKGFWSIQCKILEESCEEKMTVTWFWKWKCFHIICCWLRYCYACIMA